MTKTAAKHLCPDCGGSMEQGFLLDGRHQAQWMRGQHQKSTWTTTVFKGKERRLVETWRCASCGFLKSYARDVAR